MVKDVVKPVSVGYGHYQEIENPTPQKFFFCRYYTIHQHNSQAPCRSSHLRIRLPSRSKANNRNATRYGIKLSGKDVKILAVLLVKNLEKFSKTY